jgi:5-methyltetrahydrofolate--homocysteine methyltransferase
VLESLLSSKSYLLADGATGTNLFTMGLASGEAPEWWNLEQRVRIEELHLGFIEAGADIILTNTFGCNRRRLALHNLHDRTRELNRLGAQIARSVAEKAGREIVVAGSVGPTGDLLAPLGPLTEDAACSVFVEQMQGLKEGGADLAWIETMSAAAEIEAAARAARTVGMPYTVTASFDTAGKTMMGVTPEGLVDFTAALDPPPVAVGANCGVGASDLIVSLLAMTAHYPDKVIIAKANCGIPQWVGDHIHYSGTPDLMAQYARLAIDAGARIVGGCCGTSKVHLAAMRQALDQYRPAGQRPDVAQVVDAIGPLMAPAIAVPSNGANRRGRRRG